MIQCIAIDDEPMALELLADYVNKTPFLELKGTFRDAMEAVNFISNKPVDLVFLDINMPELTGMQFLRALSAPKPEVVFCTAYSEFALDSYEFSAIDYLLKPIEFDRFFKAVIKARDQILLKKGQTPVTHAAKPVEVQVADKPKDYLLVKSGNEIRKINLPDILFFEGTGNYLKIHTQKGVIMTLQSMKEMLSHLNENEFFRVHKSYIIAFRYVDSFERHQVCISEHRVPVGAVYRKSFQEWLEQKMP
ncbi:MAG: LytTR family DNA-binding domain-containing protein [Salinivirgaceae bacterium]